MSRLFVMTVIAVGILLSASAPADAQWLRSRFNRNFGGNDYGNFNNVRNNAAYGTNRSLVLGNSSYYDNGCTCQNQQAAQAQAVQLQPSTNLRPGDAPQQQAQIVIDPRTGKAYYPQPNPAANVANQAKLRPNRARPLPPQNQTSAAVVANRTPAAGAPAAPNLELNGPAGNIISVLNVDSPQPNSVQAATYDAPASRSTPATIQTPETLKKPDTAVSASSIDTGFPVLESPNTTDVQSIQSQAAPRLQKPEVFKPEVFKPEVSNPAVSEARSILDLED